MPRRPLDQYETPPHYVEPLLQLIGPLDGLSVYEPCVGQGHIARYLTDARPSTPTISTRRCAATLHLDARTRARGRRGGTDVRIDWTITNPPFSDELADPAARAALLAQRRRSSRA